MELTVQSVQAYCLLIIYNHIYGENLNKIFIPSDPLNWPTVQCGVECNKKVLKLCVKEFFGRGREKLC